MKKVQTLKDILNILHSKAFEIESFGVERISVFGSFVRNEQTKQSDIDFIVQFKFDHKTFKNFMALAFFLENLLDRQVELVTIESLSPYLKSEIIKEVKYVKVA